MLKILVKDKHLQHFESEGTFTENIAEFCFAISRQYSLYHQSSPDLAMAFQLMMLRCMEPDSPVWDADPVEGICLIRDIKGGASHD